MKLWKSKYLFITYTYLLLLLSFQNNDLVNDLSHIQLPNFSTLSSINSFNDSEDDLDNAFENNSSGDNNSSSNSKFSQYPRPKIVPVDYNKKKQVCVCEQCNGSWSRKEYYYHHLVCSTFLFPLDKYLLRYCIN